MLVSSRRRSYVIPSAIINISVSPSDWCKSIATLLVIYLMIQPQHKPIESISPFTAVTNLALMFLRPLTCRCANVDMKFCRHKSELHSHIYTVQVHVHTHVGIRTEEHIKQNVRSARLHVFLLSGNTFPVHIFEQPTSKCANPTLSAIVNSTPCTHCGKIKKYSYARSLGSHDWQCYVWI